MYIVIGDSAFSEEHFGIGNTIEEAVENFQNIIGDELILPKVYFQATEITVTRKVEYIITDEVR